MSPTAPLTLFQVAALLGAFVHAGMDAALTSIAQVPPAAVACFALFLMLADMKLAGCVPALRRRQLAVI